MTGNKKFNWPKIFLIITRYLFISSLVSIVTFLTLIIACVLLEIPDTLILLIKPLVIQSFVAPLSFVLMRHLEDKLFRKFINDVQ